MTKLNRSVETWRLCSPYAMAHQQSLTAIEFAFEDAQKDIIALSDELDALKQKVAEWANALDEPDDIEDDELRTEAMHTAISDVWNDMVSILHAE